MSEDKSGVKTLLERARSEHPFPWQKLVYPNGRIVIADAAGKEVSLLLMTDLVCAITGYRPA